jgi:hypothetical protein
MATYNGAWTTFDEKERGSLEAGKVADMVILSDNPYTVDNDKIRDIKVEQLILAASHTRAPLPISPRLSGMESSRETSTSIEFIRNILAVGAGSFIGVLFPCSFHEC